MPSDLFAETIEMEGHGGDAIEAYLAQPFDETPTGGIVVIHHMPGYDEATKEITRRFAAMGYVALCLNLYSREAPGASPDDAAATVRSLGGVPDERLVGDVAAGLGLIKGLARSNGKVATIGYCSGGRQSFLAGCSLDLDAAIDCYGAFVVEAAPEGLGMTVPSLLDRASDLSCALLGLFGAEDQYPSPEQNDVLRAALEDAGKEFSFHTFDDAGHAFFAVDRPSYRPIAATEGWKLIDQFLSAHLAA